MKLTQINFSPFLNTFDTVYLLCLSTDAPSCDLFYLFTALYIIRFQSNTLHFLFCTMMMAYWGSPHQSEQLIRPPQYVGCVCSPASGACRMFPQKTAPSAKSAMYGLVLSGGRKSVCVCVCVCVFK